MGERVRLASESVRTAELRHLVYLDDKVIFGSWDRNVSEQVEAALRFGLGLPVPLYDIVADTARALDGTRDTPEGGYRPGDRVRLDYKGLTGTIEGPADNGSFWVRVPFIAGDGRYYVSPSKMTFLGRDAGEPEGDDAPDDPTTFPFKVGDRVVDRDGDAATVKVVRDDGTIDVLYDDRNWGICGEVRYQNPGIFSSLTPPRPSVTPHPDRPDTADGELPEGWREDCYGHVFEPGGQKVFYVATHGYWGTSMAPGPCRFVRRSEAIARLQELLAEGGDR